MYLKDLQGFGYEIAEIATLSLTVLHLVTKILVIPSINVENWEDLTVVGHKSLARKEANFHLEGMTDASQEVKAPPQHDTT